ncbi:DMT family transporter [Actinophytocola glycyrrhizae]|uniref:DMT family transporter n=1 Tax=Actinophytocola glycyrrhizae TaxID=2044873 RepID=A0ABV9RVB2_9PSEU
MPSRAAFVAILVAVVLWGLAPVATRYLVLTADPLGVLGIRFLLCSLCYLPVLPWLRLGDVRWNRGTLGLLAACGIIGVVGYNVPMTLGIRDVHAGFAGILLSTEPLWIALLSVVVLRQRLTAPLAWGLAVAFTGVVTLSVGNGLTVSTSMFGGAALVLLGAFMWGAYSVAVGPLVRRYGALRVSAVTMWIGTVPLLAICLPGMLSTSLGTTGWVVLFLYGLGPNLVGMLLWNYGLSRVPGPQAGLLLNLYPVVSVTGGVTLLGEPLTMTTLVGGLVVLVGLLLSQDNRVSRALVPRRRSPGQARPADAPPQC